MDIGKRQRPIPDLSAILEGLISAEIEFILVGGLAAVTQGAPITTMDVDIVHDQSPENIARLQAFLKSINAIHRRPDDKIIAPKTEDFSGMDHILLSTRLGPIDILAFIEEGNTYPDLLRHSREVPFKDRSLKVLDLRRMIELKQSSRDPKDRQRMLIFQDTLRQIERF